jgi:dTDP-4-dehydrorhamnose reductase
LKYRKKDQKIIYPTTNSGYGVGQKNKYCDENSPLKPISLYGTTKAEAENLIFKAKNSICFRLATVFGFSFRMRTDLLVNNFVEKASKNKKLEVNIDFDSWLGSEFFSTKVEGKTAQIYINQEHRFYLKLYQFLAEQLDKTNVEIVDLMLMAFTRAEDELSASSVDIKTFVLIKEKWGQILTELLEEQDRTVN